MKGFKKICGICIIVFVILSICLITCSAYSNVFPTYLDFKDCAFVEMNTNLGVGSLVIPNNFQYNALTLYGVQYLANISNSTINGYFITTNGVVFDIRLQSLGTLQYRITQGYQTYYQDITYTEILNTNCNINNLESSSNDFVYHFSTFEIIVIVLLSLILITRFLQFFYNKVK